MFQVPASIKEYSDYYQVIANETNLGSTNPVTIEFRWEKYSGALKKVELTSGSYHPGDGSTLSDFLFEMVDSSTDPSDGITPEDFGIATGDTFNYQLTSDLSNYSSTFSPHHLKACECSHQTDIGKVN